MAEAWIQCKCVSGLEGSTSGPGVDGVCEVSIIGHEFSLGISCCICGGSVHGQQMFNRRIRALALRDYGRS
jgi:hypothetical protein